MAEGGGLLNRYTMSSRIEGSNPFPSARDFQKIAEKSHFSRVGYNFTPLKNNAEEIIQPS
ncbi:hypothetical protein AA11825_2180 [Acetobacter pomorum DSM 11825]|nr:hypothetical protein AA11825_2180 [Acetobacter pomorum DSM 11825]